MADGPLISVIVPIYNVERYVDQCIRSIREQSLRDIEILLLDDGSTDGSAAVCRRHAAQDDRIRFFHHDNMGLGQTRNRGIWEARGRWLAFVDSDDWIEPDHLRDLYERAVGTGADIVQGEMIQFWDGEDRTAADLPVSGERDLILSSEDLGAFFRDYYFTFRFKPFACCKLYRHSFVDRWRIKFGDNRIIYSEDTWFQLQALLRCPHIAFVSGARYRYRQRADSIMHAPRKDLLIRHGRMVRDYDHLIRSGLWSEGAAASCSLFAVEAVTLEAMEKTRQGGGRRAFLRDAVGVEEDPFLISKIAELADPRVRALEPKRGRRAFLAAIGSLYRIGAVRFANEIVWQVYRIKERRWRRPEI